MHGDFNPWNLIVLRPGHKPIAQASFDSDDYVDAERRMSGGGGAFQYALGRYTLSGIIDFGESHYTYHVFDIAIAVSPLIDILYRSKMSSELSSDTDKCVRGWISAFVAGYEEERELLALEKEALVPLILGWEALAIALCAAEMERQPDNSYVQSFCTDSDWDRLNAFLRIL